MVKFTEAHKLPLPLDIVGITKATSYAGVPVSKTVAKLMRDPGLARAAGLNAGSRVLLISTEGATAPGVYAELVGTPADTVAARRDAWMAQFEQ